MRYSQHILSRKEQSRSRCDEDRRLDSRRWRDRQEPRRLDALESPHYSQILSDIASKVVESIRAGGKIMFCGNGGTAVDSQHLAAELVGRQNHDRAPTAGIALTVDTSALTAISNDYGYETVFSRQAEALGNAGDVLIGISTSGCSLSVVRAFEAAKAKGITTVSFTGRDPRAMTSPTSGCVCAS
jgi:D-sedoheptulose 7-phosphate isomerase